MSATENRWRIAVEITEARLVQARQEFPATMPATDPSEWSEWDFVHALAAIQHRDFELVDVAIQHRGFDLVDVEPIEGSA